MIRKRDRAAHAIRHPYGIRIRGATGADGGAAAVDRASILRSLSTPRIPANAPIRIARHPPRTSRRFELTAAARDVASRGRAQRLEIVVETRPTTRGDTHMVPLRGCRHAELSVWSIDKRVRELSLAVDLSGPAWARPTEFVEHAQAGRIDRDPDRRSDPSDFDAATDDHRDRRRRISLDGLKVAPRGPRARGARSPRDQGDAIRRLADVGALIEIDARDGARRRSSTRALGDVRHAAARRCSRSASARTTAIVPLLRKRAGDPDLRLHAIEDAGRAGRSRRTSS